MARRAVQAVIAAHEEICARITVKCPCCETVYRMVLPVNTLALICVSCGNSIELRSN